MDVEESHSGNCPVWKEEGHLKASSLSADMTSVSSGSSGTHGRAEGTAVCALRSQFLLKGAESDATG
jgi:hypothetical protein